MSKYSTPVPAIDGVQVLHTPVFAQKDYSPANMARRFQMYASGKTEVRTTRHSEDKSESSASGFHGSL